MLFIFVKRCNRIIRFPQFQATLRRGTLELQLKENSTDSVIGLRIMLTDLTPFQKKSYTLRIFRCPVLTRHIVNDTSVATVTSGRLMLSVI